MELMGRTDFWAVSRTQLAQVNNTSPPRAVVFLCPLHSYSGEGSVKLRDRFIQNGVLSGRCDWRRAKG